MRESICSTYADATTAATARHRPSGKTYNTVAGKLHTLVADNIKAEIR
jgi:hypothetical protein